jgi:hypothetical protein
MDETPALSLVQANHGMRVRGGDVGARIDDLLSF